MAIKGVGIDLVEIERIATSLQKDNGFRELVFAPEEISYCESKTQKYEHYAARFAAKEAFLKALGTGWVSGTAFNEIIVQNTSTGKPQLVFTGTTAQTIAVLAYNHISLSLTHTRTTAGAVVVIE
ncbi:holo-ACP synthase [Terrimonas rubra]|uniref:Holo-[acyl-carrier-protein] synthase n=1 Tax=Terrimonas rubra TaxID=1035890 RepID=A0ABW6A366_9BACT